MTLRQTLDKFCTLVEQLDTSGIVSITLEADGNARRPLEDSSDSSILLGEITTNVEMLKPSALKAELDSLIPDLHDVTSDGHDRAYAILNGLAHAVLLINAFEKDKGPIESDLNTNRRIIAQFLMAVSLERLSRNPLEFSRATTLIPKTDHDRLYLETVTILDDVISQELELAGDHIPPTEIDILTIALYGGHLSALIDILTIALYGGHLSALYEADRQYPQDQDHSSGPFKDLLDTVETEPSILQRDMTKVLIHFFLGEITPHRRYQKADLLNRTFRLLQAYMKADPELFEQLVSECIPALTGEPGAADRLIDLLLGKSLSGLDEADPGTPAFAPPAADNPAYEFWKHLLFVGDVSHPDSEYFLRTKWQDFFDRYQRGNEAELWMIRAAWLSDQEIPPTKMKKPGKNRLRRIYNSSPPVQKEADNITLATYDAMDPDEPARIIRKLSGREIALTGLAKSRDQSRLDPKEFPNYEVVWICNYQEKKSRNRHRTASEDAATTSGLSLSAPAEHKVQPDTAAHPVERRTTVPPLRQAEQAPAPQVDPAQLERERQSAEQKRLEELGRDIRQAVSSLLELIATRRLAITTVEPTELRSPADFVQITRIELRSMRNSVIACTYRITVGDADAQVSFPLKGLKPSNEAIVAGVTSCELLSSLSAAEQAALALHLVRETKQVAQRLANRPRRLRPVRDMKAAAPAVTNSQGSQTPEEVLPQDVVSEPPSPPDPTEAPAPLATIEHQELNDAAMLLAIRVQELGRRTAQGSLVRDIGEPGSPIPASLGIYISALLIIRVTIDLFDAATQEVIEIDAASGAIQGSPQGELPEQLLARVLNILANQLTSEILVPFHAGVTEQREVNSGFIEPEMPTTPDQVAVFEQNRLEKKRAHFQALESRLPAEEPFIALAGLARSEPERSVPAPPEPAQFVTDAYGETVRFSTNHPARQAGLQEVWMVNVPHPRDANAWLVRVTLILQNERTDLYLTGTGALFEDGTLGRQAHNAPTWLRDVVVEATVRIRQRLQTFKKRNNGLIAPKEQETEAVIDEPCLDELGASWPISDEDLEKQRKKLELPDRISILSLDRAIDVLHNDPTLLRDFLTLFYRPRLPGGWKANPTRVYVARGLEYSLPTEPSHPEARTLTALLSYQDLLSSAGQQLDRRALLLKDRLTDTKNIRVQSTDRFTVSEVHSAEVRFDLPSYMREALDQAGPVNGEHIATFAYLGPGTPDILSGAFEAAQTTAARMESVRKARISALEEQKNRSEEKWPRSLEASLGRLRTFDTLSHCSCIVILKCEQSILQQRTLARKAAAVREELFDSVKHRLDDRPDLNVHEKADRFHACETILQVLSSSNEQLTDLEVP